MNDRARQRGVALITAVLIVALATILAVNVSFRGFLDQRRVATAFAIEQGLEVAKGGEAWAADILLEDAQDGAKEDHFAERWATPLPPLPLDNEGTIEGQLTDLQGRFNMNTLITLQANGETAANPPAVAHFARLLEITGVEPKWAYMIADWIDFDNNEGVPEGGEDPLYTSQTPPYRAANMPITRVSELLSMPGFGIERYRKIEPHITALPMTATTINVCTATPEVLDSITGEVNYTRSPDELLERRTSQCDPGEAAIKAAMGTLDQSAPGARAYYDKLLSTQSQYFEATIWVSIGTTQFTLYSVLHRNQNTVGTLLRSFGTR